MNRNILIGIVVVLVLAVGAFWIFATSGNPPLETDTGQTPGTSNSNTQNTNTQPGSVQSGNSNNNLTNEPAASAARRQLGTRLSIDDRNIAIVSVEEKTWSDSCLGLGGINESCAQATVAGYRVELSAQGKIYLYRTDKTGTAVRAETQ